MSAPINNGRSAFPVVDGWNKDGRHRGGEEGMTLRDYFAGQALNGILMNYTTERFGISENSIADHAYKLADAMLAERERKEDAK
jgi:hypothetical protein